MTTIDFTENKEKYSSQMAGWVQSVYVKGGLRILLCNVIARDLYENTGSL